MDKKTFINELRQGLKGLPKEEINDIIADYEEHFAVGKKKKRTEAAIAKSLGKPKDLAKQLKASAAIKKAETEKGTSTFLRAMLATIGLGFLNLVIVLGPFIALVAVIISLFATGIAISIAGLAVIIGSIIAPSVANITITELSATGGAFLGLGIACFGALFLIGTYFVSKGFGKIMLAYFKFNVHIIKGRTD